MSHCEICPSTPPLTEIFNDAEGHYNFEEHISYAMFRFVSYLQMLLFPKYDTTGQCAKTHESFHIVIATALSNCFQLAEAIF